MFHIFGDERFERLAEISNGHIYNLRARRTYLRARTTFRAVLFELAALAITPPPVHLPQASNASRPGPRSFAARFAVARAGAGAVQSQQGGKLALG